MNNNYYSDFLFASQMSPRDLLLLPIEILPGTGSECIICGKPYKGMRIHKKPTEEYPELKEVDIRLYHPSCMATYNKVQKLKAELMDAEFVLYSLRECPEDSNF